MSENENITVIAENLSLAYSDLFSVVKNLGRTVDLIQSVAGYEDDMTVSNIHSLLNTLTFQVSLEKARWNTIDDNRN